VSASTTYVLGDTSLMSRDIGSQPAEGLRLGVAATSGSGLIVRGCLMLAVVVLLVVSQQLSVTAAAPEYGFSRRHLHRLLVASREGGLNALEPRSRRPRTNAVAISVLVRERVIALRAQPRADGFMRGR
jgi:Helix-turn-helix domain